MPALLAFALAAAVQAQPAADAPVANKAAAASDVPAVKPTGIQPGVDLGAVNAGAAPTDDFGFVAWCAGATEGYLRLRPDLMPEVRRIETQFRRPGSSLEEDMKDYDDIAADGQRQMKIFQGAIQAAMKASSNSLDTQGSAAYARGLAVWAAPAGSTKARIAQEWMSWALPAKCEPTAKALASKATLLGAAFKPTTAGVVAPAVAGAAATTEPAAATPAAETSTEAIPSTAAPAEAPAPATDTRAAAPKAAPKPAAKPARKAAKRTAKPGA